MNDDQAHDLNRSTIFTQLGTTTTTDTYQCQTHEQSQSTVHGQEEFLIVVLRREKNVRAFSIDYRWRDARIFRRHSDSSADRPGEIHRLQLGKRKNVVERS